MALKSLLVFAEITHCCLCAYSWKKLHINNCTKNLVSQIFNNSKLFATNIHVLTLDESSLHNNQQLWIRRETRYKDTAFEFPTTELKEQINVS